MEEGKCIAYQPWVERKDVGLRLRLALSISGPGEVTTQVFKPPGVMVGYGEGYRATVSVDGMVREVIKLEVLYKAVFQKSLPNEIRGEELLALLGVGGEKQNRDSPETEMENAGITSVKESTSEPWLVSLKRFHIGAAKVYIGGLNKPKKKKKKKASKDVHSGSNFTGEEKLELSALIQEVKGAGARLKKKKKKKKRGGG